MANPASRTRDSHNEPAPGAAYRPASLLRRIVKRLFAAALGVCFGFLLLEVGLRLFVPITDADYQFWDPVLGARRLPDQTGRYIRPSGANAPFIFN